MTAAPEGSSTAPEPRGTGGSSRRTRTLWLAGLGGALAAFAGGWVLLSAVVGLRAPVGDPLYAPPVTSLAWWLTPRESNAFMRLPVLGGDLEALAAVPGTGRLIAVGAGGLLVLSDDGGRSWRPADVAWPTVPGGRAAPGKPDRPEEQAAPPAAGADASGWSLEPLLRAARAQEPPVSKALPWLAPSAKPLSEVLTGKSGAPGDGQRTTEQPVAPPAGADGSVEQTAPNSKAAAIEDNPPLARPSAEPPARTSSGVAVDAGARTAADGPPAPLVVRLRGVAVAPDGRVAVAVGDQGTVLVSGDGGGTWEAAPSGTSADLGAVAVSAGSAVAVGDGGVALFSTDAGKSWTWGLAVTTGSTSPLVAHSVSVGPAGGVVVARGDEIAVAPAAGGKAPAVVTEVAASQLRAVRHTSDGSLVGVGLAGTIEVSRDAGQTWVARDSPTGSTLRAIAVAGDRMLAVGDGGAVVTSSDGGETWALESSGTGADLRGAAIAGDGAAFAAGDRGLVLASESPGIWRPVSAGGRAVLHAVSFGPGGGAFAAGADGSLLRSDDGGATWRPSLPLSLPGRLLGVAHVGVGDAVAIGEDGAVVWLQARPLGVSWERASAGGRTLRAAAPDGQGGALAVGDGGAIVTLRRGQESPAQRDSGTDATLHAVAARPDGLALAVGAGGTMLRSTDAGERWSPVGSGAGDKEPRDLRAVAVDPQGAAAVVVGDAGAIRASSDAGQSWRSVDGAGVGYRAVHALGGGRFVAAGAGGAIAVSADGGASWRPAGSGTGVDLLGLGALGGRTIVAVGHGRVVRSTDGAESFAPVIYRGALAPWVWLFAPAVLFAAFVLARARSRPAETAEAEASIASLAASDRPLRAGDPDPLGFGAVASGLSAFLRNAGTDPPLTLGITGEWGTGKSSLMRLLHGDLAERGFRPVWFNAWHHQKGEQLMASLFAHIRAQGVPPVFSRLGLRYRARLLWRRGRSRWFWYGVAATVFAFASVYVYENGEAASRLLEGLGGAYQADGLSGALATLFTAIGIKGAGFLAALVLPVLAALRALRAFGVTPVALMTGVAGGGREGRERERPGARYTFAREFADVTWALQPYTMVIFIDDLDRCSRDVVPEVLETVNFLMTSGDCFVVLGMARGWVETCVGLAFQELAEEMDERRRAADDAGEGPAANPEPPVDGKRLRREFARDYLEKLLNIEVPIPAAREEGTRALLAPEAPPPTRDRVRAMRAAAREFAPALGLLAAFALGALAGHLVPAVKEARAPETRAAAGSLLVRTPGAPFEGSSEIAVPLIRRTPADAPDGDAVVLGQVAFEGGRGDVALEFASGQATAGAGKLADSPGAEAAPTASSQAGERRRRISLGRVGEGAGEAELVLRLADGAPAARGAEASGAGEVGHGDTLPLRPGGGAGDRGAEPAAIAEPPRADPGPSAPPVAALAAVLALVVFWLTLTPRGVVEKDSPRFIEALKLWHPWIVLRRNTPRAVKRYLNLVRYVAMRCRPRPGADGADGDSGLPEPVAVALAALDGVSVDAPWVRNASRFGALASGRYESLIGEAFPDDPERAGQALAALKTIVERHRSSESFTAEERALFETPYREAYVRAMGEVHDA